MNEKEELGAYLTRWIRKFLLHFLFMNCSLLMIFLLLKTSIFVCLFSIGKVAIPPSKAASHKTNISSAMEDYLLSFYWSSSRTVGDYLLRLSACKLFAGVSCQLLCLCSL